MADSSLFVSVIVPNYDGLRFLPTCLDALQAQTYPGERTEIILVDDASSDGSVAFVREHHPEVVIVQMVRNSGLAAACNAGARAAHGDWLVMLNNDTEAEPGWLAALVEAAQAHPRAGAIASKMLLFDRRDTLHNAGDLMGADGIPRNRGVWQKDEGQFDGDPSTSSGQAPSTSFPQSAQDFAGQAPSTSSTALPSLPPARSSTRGTNTATAPTRGS
jgi:GT2 family glycosyltransferase